MSILILTTYSCDEDSIPLDDQENIVTYKVFSDEEDCLILRAWKGNKLVIKNGWENTETTKAWKTSICVTCDNPNALITAELYKNHRLVKTGQANSYLNINAKLKSLD